MDLPLLVSPYHLDELSDELVSQAARAGRMSARVGELATSLAWQGFAGYSYANAAHRRAGLIDELAHRLRRNATGVDRCADELRAELATMRRIEQDVADAAHKLAHAAVLVGRELW